MELNNIAKNNSKEYTWKSVNKMTGPHSSIAPTTIIPDNALVTDINGVCREGVTFHIQ